MVEEFLWGVTIVTAIGAVIAAFQIIRVRMQLGPLFQQSDLEHIFVEHFGLGAIWLAAFMAWAASVNRWSPSPGVRDGILIALGVSIMVIVWGFVIRAHRWYMRSNGE